MKRIQFKVKFFKSYRLKIVIFLELFLILFGCAPSQAPNSDLQEGGSSNEEDKVLTSSALSIGTMKLLETEDGIVGNLDLKLNTRPSDDVVIYLNQNGQAKSLLQKKSGGGDLIFIPSSLTFTPLNWNIIQGVTVVPPTPTYLLSETNFALYFAITSNDSRFSAITIPPIEAADIVQRGVAVGLISNNTSEALGPSRSGTFSLALTFAPSSGHQVLISVTSLDKTEGIVPSNLVTFSNTNWDIPQLVTVVGVDDFIKDGNIPYSLKFTVSSTDSAFDKLLVRYLNLINIDDDSSGLVVGAVSGNTSEDLATATFSLAISSEPLGNVTINLSSNLTSEGVVSSSSSLVFTSSSWNTPQMITLTGVDDNVVDGNHSYAINFAITSADINFHGISWPAKTVINTDNDVASYTLNSLSGNSSESGDSATFSLKLDAGPTSDVIISVVSNNTSEGTVAPALLTFTTGNWNILKTVTVTGVDDAVVDGTSTYTLSLSFTSSSAVSYRTLTIPNITVLNLDNDSSGLTVGSVSGNTNESGSSATFTLSLTSQPTSNVAVSLSSSHSAEGVVSSPHPINFTASNWSTPRTVTITGVNDDDIDGNISYVINFSLSSSDSNYHGLSVAGVNLVNIDNDMAGMNLSSISGNTSENGATATFTASLKTRPTGNVTVNLSSSHSEEGAISSANPLVFTNGNWNTTRTITVSGLDDNLSDGNITYAINFALTSSDNNYHAMAVAGISVVNTDNDVYGFTLSAISGNTTEAGGTATFTLKLNAQPTADVTINFSSSHSSEGTVTSPNPLILTAGNWNNNQVVTVTGVDDFEVDGNITYAINLALTSGDINYHELSVAGVNVINTDNDFGDLNIGLISGPTSEDGGTATLTVSLTSLPSASVTVEISSSNSNEGSIISANPLIFTPGNWNSMQTVTLSGADDFLVDGNVTYVINFALTSADSNYHELAVEGVSVVNIDNDVYGFTLSNISGNTTEAGGTAIFTLKLNAQPTADVRISVVSDNSAEGSVAPGLLNFTSSNWNNFQTVIVTGEDEAIDDGDSTFTISLTVDPSSASSYSTLTLANVTVINVDNDTRGVSVSNISGNTSEDGGTAIFTLSLNTQPTSSVTVNLSSSNSSKGTVSSANPLTFTAGNWNTMQTVTVTGVNDDVADGNINYAINFALTSGDSNYHTLAVNAVNLVNIDNDVADFIVSSISGNTTEAGGQATFTMVLTSQPSANVIVNISSNQTAEGTVAPTTLTITSANWSIPKSVTVTGQNDEIVDGSVAFNISLSVDPSSATEYKDLLIAPVNVINEDDDVPGFYQQAYLKAANAHTFDLYGISVDIDGDTVVVGARDEDSAQKDITNGTGVSTSLAAAASGAAYIYKRTGSTWVQEAYLKASNSDAGDKFGIEVRVSGDTVVVASRDEDSNQSTITNGPGSSTNNINTASGAVFIYKRTGSTWAQEAYLKASNSGLNDWYGATVDISGDTVVVGAWKESSNQNTITNGNTSSPDNSFSLSGAAYIYQRTGSTWAQEAYLKAANVGANDEYGWIAAISGNTVVIGSTKEDSNQSTITNGVSIDSNEGLADSGAAYIYQRTGSTWVQEAYLKAYNPSGGDNFGYAVDIDEDTVAVGSWKEDSDQTTITNGAGTYINDNLTDSGAVYVYKRTGATWVQEAYIKASNARNADHFGRAVKIKGNLLVVGAILEDSCQNKVSVLPLNSYGYTCSNSGAAYVYERTGSTWAPISYLKAGNTTDSDEFGRSVSISGETVIVGSWYERSNQNEIINGTGSSSDTSANRAGAAYIYFK